MEKDSDLKEHDVVILKEDIEIDSNIGLPAGSVGTVVHVYNSKNKGKYLEVEFNNMVVTLLRSQIKKS